MGWFRGNYRLLMLCLLVFLLTFGLGTFIGDRMQIGPFEGSIAAKAERGKQINILFMGTDARKNETNSRSDTMILASLDTKENKIAMVWIPRDTRVEVKKNKYDRINSVNYLQGPEAACSVVADLLDIPLDHYVVTNFNGFAGIVDILGGVTLEIPSPMFHNDPDPTMRINLPAGTQRLNGQEALGYVRYRGGPTADIGRTGRQQKFIKALAGEMLQSKTILKLPELLPELSENVHTNIPVTDMLMMAKMAKDLGDYEMYTQTLPGYSYTDKQTGASYWQADSEIAAGIVAALFAGEKYDVAQDPPQTVKSQPHIEVEPIAEEEIEEDIGKESEEGEPGQPPEEGDGEENGIPAEEGDGEESGIPAEEDAGEESGIPAEEGGTPDEVDRRQEEPGTSLPEPVAPDNIIIPEDFPGETPGTEPDGGVGGENPLVPESQGESQLESEPERQLEPQEELEPALPDDNTGMEGYV